MIYISRQATDDCESCGHRRLDGHMLQLGIGRDIEVNICEDCADTLAIMIKDEVDGE